MAIAQVVKQPGFRRLKADDALTHHPRNIATLTQVVKQPGFHRRLKAEMDLVEGVELEESIGYILVRVYISDV